MLQCFLNRAYRLCSTKDHFATELDNIRSIFKSNGYPMEFIESSISVFSQKVDDTSKETEKPPEVVTEENVEEKRVYLVLPYVGRCSQKLHRRISSEMAQHGITILPAFRTTKVQSYFSLKTKTPPLFKADVVYKFECPCDKGSQYVGETERQFFIRVKDHCTASNNAPSAVFDHVSQCADCDKAPNIVNQFSIIRQCTRTDILSQEALCIKRYQPSLNIQLGPYKGCRVGMSIFS